MSELKTDSEVSTFDTGLPELDNILNSKGLNPVPMIIDKEVFDNTIIPLLTDGSLELTDDERYNHLHNIWVNYYKDTFNKVKPSLNFSRDNNSLIAPMNAVYTPMAVVDLEGNIIATTPSLLQSAMLPGITEVFASYELEQKNSPMEANAKLINTFRALKLGDSNEWELFLNSYLGDRDSNGESYISQDDNQGLLEG